MRKEARVKRILALGFAAIAAVVALDRGLDAPWWAQTAPLPATSSDLERRDQSVTAHDVQILTRAAELLEDESAWNRADDRECADDEATGKRSLFCALPQAGIEVLGKYDHRRVALQEVRFAVEDATRGRDFEHRLRDFNNLPETQLVDVKKVIQVAADRVKSRLKP